MSDKEPKPSLADRSPILRWWNGRGKPAQPGEAPKPRARIDVSAPPAFAANFLKRRPNWHGPSYMAATAWRHDLMIIANSLAAIVSVNAPLARGVGALMAEHGRGRDSDDRFSKLLGLLLALVVCALLILAASQLPEIVGKRFWRMNDYMYFAVIAMIGLGVVAVSVGVYIAARNLRSSFRKRVLVLGCVQRSLNQGEPLSKVMYQLKNFFPRHYVDLVAAGERSGQLAECLNYLKENASSQYLESQRRGRTRLYFIIVLTLVLLISSFIFVKVAPVFGEILEEFGAGMPASAARVVDVFDVFFHVAGLINSNARWMLAAFTLPPVLALLAWFVARLRARCDKVASTWIWLPYIGRTAVLRSLRHAASMLGPELDAGIPLDQCLSHLAAASLMPSHRRAFQRARERVRQGEALSEALRKAKPGLPEDFICFVELGESSGQLPEAIHQAARIYAPIVDARQRIAATVAFCASTLIVAALVYAVVGSSFRMVVEITEAVLVSI